MISIIWRCDGCAQQAIKDYSYKWEQGLGDIWHPKGWSGFTDKLFCAKCHRAAVRKFMAENLNVILTA